MLAGGPVISYVTSLSVNDGFYKAGSAITIDVVFDKNVLVGGAPTLQLETGATDRLAVFQSAQGSTARFLYTPQPGDETADLDYSSTTALNLGGGVILAADGSGAADLTLPSPGDSGSLGFNKNISIDTEAPAAPTVNYPILTAQKRPELTGTATLGPGETLTVTVNGITFSTASPGGITTRPTENPWITWSLNTKYAAPLSGTFSDLADGRYPVTATVIDAAGNSTPDATTDELTVDTTPPSAPTVTALVTKARKPTVTGTATLADGDTLKVTINEFVFDRVPVVAGTWSLDTAAATSTPAFAALTDGTYDVIAKVTDQLGNSATDSSTGELVIDNAGPTVLSVTSSTPDGAYNADKMISIQVQLNEIVTVVGSPRLTLNTTPTRYATYVDKTDDVLGTILNFTYSVAAGDTAADLDYASDSALSANGGTIRDAAGNDAALTLKYASNKGDLANAKDIEIDTTAPAAPTVTKKAYNTNLPTIEGTIGTPALAAGENLTVKVNGATYENVAVIAGTTGANGTWSIDTSSLEPTSGEFAGQGSGTYSVLATVTDAAGNQTKDPTINEITISTDVPPAPTVDQLLTNVKKPTITGTAVLAANQTLSVTLNGVTFNSVEVTNEVWSLDTATATPTPAFADLADGTYNVIATVKDDAGNSATDTVISDLVIDTVAAKVLSVTSSSTDGAYNAGKTISIQVQLNEIVTVVGSPRLTLNTTPTRYATYVDKTDDVLGTILNFTYSVAAGDTAADLDYASDSALSANGGTIRDAAGNDAALTLKYASNKGDLANAKDIEIDTTAPAAPTVNKQTTLNKLPIITGTATLARGESLTVSIRDNGTNAIVNGAIYDVAVGGDGKWSLDLDSIPTQSGGLLSALPSGIYSVLATVTDAAGNSSSDGTAKELTIAPGIQMVTSSAADGVYGVGRTIPIQVLFSDPVIVTPAILPPTLTLGTSPTNRKAEYDAAASAAFPGGRVLVFNYVVQPGDSAADLDYKETTSLSLYFATIRDASDTDAGTALPAPNTTWSLGGTKDIEIDTTAPTTAPTVTPLNPTNNPRPTLSGTATLDAGETLSVTVNGFTFTNIPVNGGTWTLNTATATPTPATPAFAPLADGVYEVTATVADGAGNSISDATSAELTIDTVRPTVTITSDVAALRIGQTATITFTLSEASKDFATNDAIAGGGALGPIAVTPADPLVYTATFTPNASSTANGTVSVAATRFMDTAGNWNVAGALAPVIAIDTVAPSVTITSSRTTLNGSQTATITFTLSENSTDFGTGDATATGGTLGPITGSGRIYTATFTPAGAGTGTVSVATGTFTDAAGNDNVAGTLTPTITIDTVAPTVTIASDTYTLRAGQTATISFTLSEPSTNFATGDATATGGILGPITPTADPLVYTAIFTPNSSPSATGTVSVAAGRFTDAAGNNNLAGSLARTIRIDTVAPAAPTVSTLSTNNPRPTLTGNATLGADGTLTVTVNGVAFNVSSVVSGKWTLNTATATPLNPPFLPLADGTYDVVATVSDGVGNTTSDTTTNELTVDTLGPTVAITPSATTLKAGQTATITFTLSEPSRSFTATDVTATGGTVSGFTGSGANYTATFTPTPNWEGTGTVTVAAGAFTDDAGNPNTVGTLTPTIAIDTLAPTVAITSNTSTLKAGQTATITFTLSENSTNFTDGDVAVTGGTLSNFAGSGSVYTATFTPTSSPSASGTVSVAAGTFTDAAGNSNVAGVLAPPIAIDTVAPTVVSITSDTTTLKAGQTATITFTLSDNSTNFKDGAVTVTGGTLSNFAGSGSVYTATFTPTPSPSATGTVSVAAGTFTDLAGNPNTGDVTGPMIAIDTAAPTVSSLTSLVANGTYGPGQVIRIAVNLSEPVVVTGTPLLLLNTSPARAASFVSVSGASMVFEYTVQIGDVAARLNQASTSALTLNGGTIRDAVGNDAGQTLPALNDAASLAGSSVIVIDGTIRITVAGFSTDPLKPTIVRQPVTTIRLTFNTPVSRVNLRGFRLFFQNRSVSLAGAVVRGSGTSWTLVLPKTATSLKGNYRLEIGGMGSYVTAGGVSDTQKTKIYWRRA